MWCGCRIQNLTLAFYSVHINLINCTHTFTAIDSSIKILFIASVFFLGDSPIFGLTLLLFPTELLDVTISKMVTNLAHINL